MSGARSFERFEYPVLVVLATLGMMLMVSANDLIALYLGLELQSLALYVIAAFNRDYVALDRGGAEVFRPRRAVVGHAALRRSLIYGFTGAHRLRPASPRRSHGGEPSLGLIFGLVFLIAGLAFKISAVPFHMWTPDVYEGAPTPVTAFFAAAPKVAAMALFVRVLFGPFAADHAGLAADRHLHRDRLDGARRLRRHRPEQHQAPDGLLLDRPCRLCAGRPRGRHRGRRAAAS